MISPRRKNITDADDEVKGGFSPGVSPIEGGTKTQDVSIAMYTGNGSTIHAHCLNLDKTTSTDLHRDAANMIANANLPLTTSHVPP